MENPVELALAITLTAVLLIILVVGIVIVCVYRKPINETFNNLEFNNEEHEAKKLAKLDAESKESADKDYIDKK